MVINIIPTASGGFIGPGLPLTLSSSVFTPPTTPALWDVSVALTSTPLQEVIGFNTPYLGGFIIEFAPLSSPTQGIRLATESLLRMEDAITVTARLYNHDNSTHDSGTATAIWNSTDGLGMQAFLLGSRTSFSLSAAEAAQLTDIQNKTTDTLDALTIPVGSPPVAYTLGQLLTPLSIDSTTLTELSPGITAAPVTATLHVATFGILVRIASVPPDLTPRTPDGNYWSTTLAVCRIFRGTDIWKRVPIHTSSAIVEFPYSRTNFIIQAVEQILWPDNTTVEVDWLPGVTGQVYSILIP